MFKFSAQSIEQLKGVHPDLVRVIYRALQITDIDFAVIDGLRTPEEAAANLAKGTSKTKRSRHLVGRAVDLNPVIDGKRVSGDAKNWHYFQQLSDWVLKAAQELNVPVEWGGFWHDPVDGYHFQLSDSFR